MGQAADGAKDRSDAGVAEGPVLRPECYVPALITHLSNVLTSNASTFYRAHFGVGVTDWRILYRLASEPWVTAQHLSTVSSLDKAVVSRSLAGLERQGYVLIRNDESDARRRLIALSPSGRDLYTRITTVALERERNFLTDLTDDEVASVVDLLNKLIGSLDAFSTPVAIPPPGLSNPADPARAATPRRQAGA